MNTRIISAFPGIGKSYLHSLLLETGTVESLDSDSTNWSWIRKNYGEKFRNPLFPSNYVDHICVCMTHFDFIFVSSHDTVRKQLLDANIKYDLIYPKMELKEEYIERYSQRGSPVAFINLLIDQWENWVTELTHYEHPGIRHTVLDSGQYLSDVIL